MDTSILKEMLLADKKEYDEYIDRFYKRIHEIDEIIWRIESIEKKYAAKQEEITEKELIALEA